MDEIYERIENPEECTVVPTGKSEIQEFYAGQTVFLTGCTGFLGRCIVEKLLRSCPDMKKLYLLVRPKRNWTVEERMKRFFENIMFDKLRETAPSFHKKVVALEGDLTGERLGLSPRDWDTLIQETNIILHNAATVKFDEKISVALKINVLGTKQMLEVGKECENLKVFMYVSTAYSNCYMDETEEKFYPPPADMEVVHDIIAADENLDGISDDALKIILGEWPNTYTFTKAIAEGIVRERGEVARFPIGVFRPSIVLSTYKEPIPGWCGNLNGPAMGMVAAGLGLLHTLWASSDDILDLVPADMCANGLLATSWDVANNKKDLQQPMVYHYGTSTVKPINLKRFQNLAVTDGWDRPSIKQVWYYFMIFTENYWLWFILDKLTHFLPAAIVDFVLLVQGKKTIALSTYFKVNKYLDVIWYFVHGHWQFHTTEIQKVWDRMNLVDSDIFYCDIRKFEWEEYTKIYWNGLRMYSIKDSLDTLDEARSKFNKLTILHFALLTALSLSALYVTISVAIYFVNIF